MIDVHVVGSRPSICSVPLLTTAVEQSFRAARITAKGDVSIAFVSDKKMRSLNRTWRKKDRSTDVLSFAPSDGPRASNAPHDWGDIVVSPSFVRTESRRRRIAFREELLRVIIHGMLHLMGHDHATIREERVMFGMQERALKRTLLTV